MTRQEITEFYQEHHRRLYNISLRILQDSDEAEEVMQDTILKYVSAEATFSSPAQVSAWLARTCIRASIDRLRRRHRKDAFLEDYAREQERLEPSFDVSAPSFAGSSPSFAGLTGESPGFPGIEQVRSAMDALPEPYRLIVDLVLIEGLDYGEIAAITGRKETTLRSLFARGRHKLIDLLRQI